MKERQKQFDKLPNQYKSLFIETIRKIQSGDTSDMDIKDFGNNEYRCRVGKYRIIYTVINGQGIIKKIGPRGDVYK